MSASRLALADWLVEAGAGESARRVLGNAPGFTAGRIRAACDRAHLAPGIYALVALADGQGIVVPMRPIAGRSAAQSASFRDACATANRRAREILALPAAPEHHFELEDALEVDGDSIGLAALLALVAHASTTKPTRAVLTTGALGSTGHVEPVGHLAAKLAAANAERATTSMLVLAPRVNDVGDVPRTEVEADLEAVRLVFDTTSPPVDTSKLDIEAVLGLARRAESPRESVRLLEAIDTSLLPTADRCRVGLELGTALRHAGRTTEAAELHGRVRQLLERTSAILGTEASERYAIELAATRLDAMELELVIASLRRRLEEPFANLRNELRARGLLAQALGMSGRASEAVAVRRENLTLHDLSTELGATRAGTLCYLALDAARAGEVAAARGWMEALARETRVGDDAQWRYSGAAIVRTLVLLGDAEEATAFARGERDVSGVRAPRSFVDALRLRDSVAQHPETSTLRALLRAYRRTRSHEALGLAVDAAAAPDIGSGLVGWVLGATQLEASMALTDLGRPDEALALRRSAEAAMMREHPAACAVHPALFRASGLDLERAIDAIWY